MVCSIEKADAYAVCNKYLFVYRELICIDAV